MLGAQRFYARAIQRDGGSQIVLGPDMTQEPGPQPPQGLCDLAVQSGLQRRWNFSVQRINALLQALQPEGALRHHKGARHFRAAGARHFLHPGREHRSRQIDDAVGQARGNDFALQAMLRQFGGELRGSLWRKIGRQSRRQRRIIGQGAGKDFRIQVELGIGQQHRQFGPRQALAVMRQGGDLGIGGQVFHRPVQLATAFQLVNETGSGIQIMGA